MAETHRSVNTSNKRQQNRHYLYQVFYIYIEYTKSPDKRIVQQLNSSFASHWQMRVLLPGGHSVAY